MSGWKYTDATGRTVVRALPTGEVQSTLAASLPAGEVVEPADQAPPIVPQSVTRFQARAALDAVGLLAAAQSLMANPQTPALARLAWQDALEFKRTSPTLLQLAPLLGIDSSALDALFTRAAAIDA